MHRVSEVRWWGGRSACGWRRSACSVRATPWSRQRPKHDVQRNPPWVRRASPMRRTPDDTSAAASAWTSPRCRCGSSASSRSWAMRSAMMSTSDGSCGSADAFGQSAAGLGLSGVRVGVRRVASTRGGARWPKPSVSCGTVPTSRTRAGRHLCVPGRGAVDLGVGRVICFERRGTHRANRRRPCCGTGHRTAASEYAHRAVGMRRGDDDGH